MKKKILFLINDLSGGGAEKVLIDIINNLNVDKYEVTCKVLFHRGPYKDKIGKHINYQYTFNKLIRGYSKISKIIPSSWLYKLVIREKYDLEIAFLEGVSTKVISGSKYNKIAWIHTNLSETKIYTQGFFNKKQVDLAYQKYQKIICVSNDVKDAFENKSNIAANVIYNPIFIDSGKLESVNFDEKYFNIVAVGRLIELKGFERIIDSIKDLGKNYDIKLYIIGDGNERANLEKKILEYGLSDKIEILGFRNDVLSFVKAADLLVCSSYREGLSTVVGEAIMLGTPVLTTDCSGMHELLKDGYLGLIVENSTEDLTNGLRYLLEHPIELKNYRERMRKFKTEYTFEYRLLEIENLIDATISNFK